MESKKIIHNNPAKMKRKPKRARLLPMDECQHRPCEVDGRPALFHRWVEEDRVLLNVTAMVPAWEVGLLVRRYRQQNVAAPGLDAEIIRETFALVEYQDGTVAKVKPELLRFT